MDEMSRLSDRAEARAPRVPHDVIKVVLATFDKWGAGQSVGLSAEEALELAGQLTALAQPVPAHSGHYGVTSHGCATPECGIPEHRPMDAQNADYGVSPEAWAASVCPDAGIGDHDCVQHGHVRDVPRTQNPAYGAGGEL